MLLALLASSVLFPTMIPYESPATADHLRCEYRVDPLGIDVTQPRLCWEMHDPRRAAAQTAYQILVASTPEKLAAGQGDLWDSGRVKSDETTQIVYAGKPLGSRMQCFWKVRLWDAQGKVSAYSQPAQWSMGLLAAADRKAHWIGFDGLMVHPSKSNLLTLDGCPWVWYPEKPLTHAAATPHGERFFRGYFTLPAGARVYRARFQTAATGNFDVFFNGKGVGHGDPKPDAHKRAVTFDLTSATLPGRNCLAVKAGPGPNPPAGLAGKLLVELDGGETLVALIDHSWKAYTASVAKWNLPDGNDSAWPAAKEIAKVGDKPWGTPSAEGSEPLACPHFRKDFRILKSVRRATVYASALGLYRVHVNGEPVTDDCLNPGWTDYHRRVYYNTYDVTNLVRAGGANTIGATLAAGWYSGAIGWMGERFHYGRHPRVWVQLEIEATDGSRQTIVSDGTWKGAYGPYIESEFLAGETYDARLELSGWSSPGFNASQWLPVAVTSAIEARLEANPGVSVKETGRITPKKISQPRPGVYVFDMGQNFAGLAELKVQGPAGTRVVMRFAEMLNPDGTIYTANLRSARSTDTYILKGVAWQEIWRPRYTFHGFRYIEMTGYPGKPDLDALTGIAINSATPMVGAFECSSPMVNQLYSNILWTQRANFISIPTDCPQRDERLGWTGDAEVFVRAATYNADVAAFYTKWLVDLHDDQHPDGAVPDVAPQVVAMGAGTPAWADAGTVCPWTIWQVYGDTRLAARHFDMMVKWVEYCRRHSKGLLRPNQGYGDWLSIGADTPKDVLATAYFAYSAHLTAEVARVIGRLDEAQKYEELFLQIKAAFNKAYVTADGRIKGNTQTCYVLALYFDLLPTAQRGAAARHLVDDIQGRGVRLSTGFVGTSFLMPVLSQTGNTPLAYQLLLTDQYPSWGYSIKHGATSIWERWDGWTAEKGFQDPGMNSFAHYSFGAVGRWMFQSVAGIDSASPGFKRLLIRPQPAPGLTWVKASYDSIHGRIASAWTKTADGLTLEITIPANTRATLFLPAGDPRRVSEGGRPLASAPGLKLLGPAGPALALEAAAGQYVFTIK
jgi:alpha-L-rhamnosidase